MVPSQRSGCISPRNIYLEAGVRAFIFKHIAPEIPAQEQTVFMRKLVIYFCIEVVEVVGVSLYFRSRLYERPAQEQIKKCSPGRNNKGACIFFYRPLHGNP